MNLILYYDSVNMTARYATEKNMRIHSGQRSVSEPYLDSPFLLSQLMPIIIMTALVALCIVSIGYRMMDEGGQKVHLVLMTFVIP